ncbi:MAG: gamma-glutamyltranspeptidase/glutathione hydrolase [Paraglaciecola psychrophila]
MFKQCYSVCLATLILVSSGAQGASPAATQSERGMVTSRSELASRAGVELLAAGGNAIDAAVATGFALAVTYPSAGNLGGGGFALVRLASGEVLSLDHREKAPASAHRDMFIDAAGNIIKNQSRSTHRAAGVPGSVDGLLTLLEKYGSKSRQQVMAPAIELASQGFILNRDLAGQFNTVAKKMSLYPGSMAVFTDNGKDYQSGDLFVQADLAKTLQAISASGREGFYSGEVAGLIVAEMARGNGEITLQDLADYRSVWRQPVKSSYRGHTIWGMAAPSSGGVLIAQMLNMFEPFDVKKMGWGSAELIHLMVEGERRAYADRADHLGDPDFVDVPMAKLIDKDYAGSRFADFDKNKATDSKAVGAGSWPAESTETTHYSVADGEGNLVSLTTTINSGYGNKIVVQGAGFLLNNEMNDFSLKENTRNQFNLIGRSANAIAPGKRMLSSMSPTIVTKDGQPLLVTGSPGGSTIITTVLQVVMNVIDHGMDISEAVSLPRFHHQWMPNQVFYGGQGITPDTKKILESMGHKKIQLMRWGRGIGDANSIAIKDGVLHGIDDPRTEGAAIGL